MTAAEVGWAAGRRVLGLFAHPDDEAFSAAGTLRLCSRLGAAVTLICATRGEAGAIRRGSYLPHRNHELAPLRSDELAASCATLGAQAPIFFDLPDGGLAALPHGLLAAKVESMLRERRPDLLITLGAEGAYGHRDHIALTGAVDRALVGLAPEGLPLVLHAAFPSGLMRPVWRALRNLPDVIEPGLAADQLGITGDQADLKVKIASVRDAKLEAIACHRSQLVADDPRSFLRPGLVDQLLDQEWFTINNDPIPGDRGSGSGRDRDRGSDRGSDSGRGGGRGRGGGSGSDRGSDRGSDSGRDSDRGRDRGSDILAALPRRP